MSFFLTSFIHLTKRGTMEEVIKIKGGKKLSGVVNISGSKNNCVSLIPAALLSRGLVVIHNIPPISDVYRLVDILEQCGVCITYTDNTLIIDSSNFVYKDLTMPEMGKLRASYYFYSVFLGLFKYVKANTIGGCRLGDRPIDLHLYAFKQLGTNIIEEDGTYVFDGTNLKSGHIIFEKSSVGATVNAIILATQIKGKTIIENVAMEPEITELINFLCEMGAKIKGKGTNTLIIYGGQEMHGVEFSNIPDRIEVGTYALIGAALGNNLKIKPVIPEHIQSLLELFNVLNINYQIKNDTMIISASPIKQGVVILTSPFPGFPTDLQQPLTTFLSISNGTSVIIESIYHNRFAHVKELNKMGANINISNMNIIIHGVNTLNGTIVSGKDLRGAASLVLAGLMAKGETIVRGLDYINRGYENMIVKLKKIHANVEIVSMDLEEQ